MRIGKGNRSTRRKPAPVPLYPPQIPHDLTWARIRDTAVGRRRLTARAMARPYGSLRCQPSAKECRIQLITHYDGSMPRHPDMYLAVHCSDVTFCFLCTTVFHIRSVFHLWHLSSVPSNIRAMKSRMMTGWEMYHKWGDKRYIK
jgi:hypothetical protein